MANGTNDRNNIPPASGAGRFINRWTITATILVVVMVTCGAVIWSKRSRSQDIEISIEPARGLNGRIYIDGEVNIPGLYPWQNGDSIDALLRAAGGVTDNADLNRLELTVAGAGDGQTPQKVDINRAEAWLLAALPGIGDARARAIIDYRQRHGPFRDINELLQVPGMGDAIFEGIKSLVTVNE